MLQYDDWYTIVRRFTERLVTIRSVSPGKGEIEAVHEVLRMLGEDDASYTAIGLDPVAHDPYGRQNAYAFLKGKSSQTLVLIGHIDTVDTKDYGIHEPLALNVDAISEKREQLGTVLEGTDPHDWMFGRGTVDMKCGVAAIIALMRYYALSNEQPPISLVMLVTPDEENESAGVLQGVHFLTHLRERHDLEYIGVINTDYTTALYPGDPHRYVFSGTVGKLLPSFLCIGQASHVGAPFNGLDANLLASELIRCLSMNDELCDVVRGQMTVPPVTLHFTDLKDHYDVQLPFMAYFYLNVLTFTTTPEMLLEHLRTYAQSTLTELLERMDATEKRWRSANGEQMVSSQLARQGIVLTYAELYEGTVQRLGRTQVEATLLDEWNRWPVELDKRERSLHLTQKLWTLSGRSGPAIVIYYAPPYYPHITATPGPLQQVIDAVVEHHPELALVHKEYYPYLSDISYLRLDPETDVSALTANMPVWRESSDVTHLSGSYCLPLDKIATLNIPVVDFGPYGQGAHQQDEAALMSYSFGILPQLLSEVIESIGKVQM